MPKKKPLDKRLKNLFEDVKPDQTPAETTPAPRKRVPAENALPSAEIQPAKMARQPVKSLAEIDQEDSVMTLAFQAGQNTWATLQVMDETEQRRWNQDEQLLVKQVADQLSLALENARLFQETQSRAEELAVLNEMGNELSAQLNINGIAGAVYRHTSRLMDTKNFFMALYDEKNDEKSYPLVFEEGQPLDLNPSKVTGRGFTDYIIRNKRYVFAPENVLGHMRALGIDFVPLSVDDTPSQCWLGVPMMIGDRVVGVISVQSVERSNLYNEHDRDLLNTIASQAAITIENARLFKETQEALEKARYRAEAENLVNDIAAGFLNIDRPEMIDQVISENLEKLGKFFGIDRAYIFLFNKDGLTMDNTHEWRQAEIESYMDDFRNIPRHTLPYMMKSLKRIEPFVVESVIDMPEESAKDKAEYLGKNIQSILCAPIALQNQLVGFVGLDSVRRQRSWPEEDIFTLRLFGQITIAALDRARNQDALAKSETDLRALFSSMQDVVIVYDKDGRYARIAPTNPSLLFRPPQEMVGKLIHEVLPKDLHEPFMATINKVLAGEENVNIEYPLTLNGQRFWFDASVSKLTEDQVFWVARDITERKQAEDALRESDARTRLILETAIDAFISIDSESSIMEWNPQAAQIFGWTREEAIGRNLADLIIPETYRNAHKHGVQHYLATGEGPVLNQRIEITGLHRDGHLFPIELAITSIPTAGGSNFTAFVRDITERKTSEEALASSRQMLRQVLDTIPSRVFWKDHKLNFVGSNQAFALDAGLKSPEDLVGKNDFDMTWAEQAKLYQTDDRAVMESQQSKLNFEEPHTADDGRITWVRTSKVPLLNTRGQVDGILGIYDDVTAEKEAEEAIRRQNQYLAVSSEIGRIVTSTLDLNSIFTRTVSLISERFGFYFAAIYITEETGFNVILREATGEAGEKMKAQRYSVVKGFNSIVGKVAESGESMLVNDVQNQPLFHPNPLLLDTLSEVAIPLRIGTRIVGVIDIQSTERNAFTDDDITVLQSLADQVAVAIDNARSYELSQQLIQDLREVDQLKSQFLANMSHELRTPLNSIIGFSRVILKGIDGPVSEMQQQDLTAIYNSGQHLLGLINDVLDLARIEAGKMELNFEEVHLAEMTTSVMSTAKGLIKEKPIQLLQRIPTDMPAVRGDTMRVRQVLLNLISNASKFTDEGSITVETRVQKGPTGKMEALINVIDTGPGISEEDQEKLFKAFSQVDGSATRKSGGSGLGLSICANLVQLHNGLIGVHSENGKGSTFWFTLPLYHQPEEEIPAGTKIILAIDDDPQVISLYERYLNPQGYHVVPLTDPSKAKERILEVQPFAVTLDIMMPSLDGWSVLTELKSDPATRDFPVIICSITEKADKGFSLGAADYLVKPILEEDLVHALDRLNKNGEIHEVLVIDDDPNDLRLIGKILEEQGRYKPVLIQGGRRGWEAINEKAPHAIILDIFMPDLDGFTILEYLRDHPTLRNIPVLVVSGGGLTNEQQQQLNDFGQRLITKGSLNEAELLSSIEDALKRIGP